MNENLNNLETIRQYLLGRISDETRLEEIEELLFADDDFCTRTEIVEDELINDFVFGKLNAEDNLSFEKTLETNFDRRAKVKVTQLLKEKTAPQIVEEKVSFFESLKAFFRQPIYAGGLALLLIAILIGAILLSRSPNNPELAELKNIYQKNRPTESRISEFDYAPYEVTRGENDLTDAEKRKLKIIENDLLKKVDGNPNALNHNALGIFYLSQKKYSEAIKEFEESVKLEPNNAKFYNDLGSAFFESGKSVEKDKRFVALNRANDSFSKALEINPNFLEALFNKSLSLQENKLFFEAKKSWEIYLQKDSNSKWADEARKNLEKISQLQSHLRKTKEQVLDDFLNAYRNKDEKMVWKIHNSTKGLLNRTPLAAQLTNRFLEARQNKDDTAANESIEALKYIGKLEKETHADFFFADLADFYAEVEEAKLNDLLTAKKLLTEGLSLVSEQKTAESIVKFDESKVLFQRINNPIEADFAELWSSQMSIYRGNLQESSNRMKPLLENSEARKHQVISANLHYWMGNCAFRQGKFSEHLQKTEQAFKLSQQTQNFYETTHSAESLFSSFSRLGNITKSLEFIHPALIDENSYYTNPGQNIRIIRAVSEFFSNQENGLSAIDFANEALEINEFNKNSGEISSSLLYLIKALAKNQKYEKASEIADYAIETALKLEPTDLNKKTLADIYQKAADLKREMNQCESALSDYQKSLEFYNARNEVSYNAYDLEKGRLLCLKKLNRDEEFQASLAKLLQLLEDVRQRIKEDGLRQTYFENEQTIFDLAIENALSRNEKEQAFNFAETSKSRSLLDFVQSKDKSIAKVEQDFGNFSKPLTLNEIQTKMPENVQIVEYSVLADKIAVWIVTKNRFELIEKKVDSTSFSQKVREYQNLIKAKGDANLIKKIAQEFYELLIPNGLEKDKILCLIPDKFLFRIPFVSLISPDGKYLVEEFALQNSPSSSVFTVLTENAKHKTGAEKLLSIGNPKFNREINQNLADLPDAEIEAKEIAKNYTDSRQFIGDEATKQNFLDSLETTEIIHFAGHFAVNEQSFEDSRMLFTEADLFASEFAGIKLPKAKLAILSACETGLEKLNSSEGAIGIYRTFLAVGTPLVLASNWKVDSAATKDLMISFHRKRKSEKLPSVEALRQSQLEMLQKQELAHSFYWSAFSLNGGLTDY
jgi:CHAT domain-containing protein